MPIQVSILSRTIDACRQQDRLAQKELYRQYYAYGLTICLHYAVDHDEAREILNDGFLRAFKTLNQFDSRRAFKPWLRRVLVNAAIDHYRKHRNKATTINLAGLPEQPTIAANGFDHLALDDLLRMVQQLSPAYRMVFNLHVIEGFSHREIAERLHITVGASKSNLTRAKFRLREMLHTEDVNIAKISQS